MTSKTPVVFIHGLWLHATSWQPWLDLFTDAGYSPIAPGWPGDAATVTATRADPVREAGHGVAEITAAYADIIRDLPAKPVIIGHSFGGLVAQKLLGQGLASSAIAIDSAAMKRVSKVTLPILRSSLPILRKPSNKSRAVCLTRSQFRYGFGNAIPQAESDALFAKWSIPGPGLPLFELVASKTDPLEPTAVDTGNQSRGPLLLIGGQKDHTVPESVTRLEYAQYRGSRAVTDYKVFASRGHSLVIDSGWREIADYSLSWLATQSRRL